MNRSPRESTRINLTMLVNAQGLTDAAHTEIGGNEMQGIGRLGWIQIDAGSPMDLATFWSKVLGQAIDDSPLGDPPQYVGLGPGFGGVVVSFQRVSEPKTIKNRLHLDVEVDDVEVAQAEIERLGGRRLPMDDFYQYGFHWRQMADPEGNEFCLIYDRGR
jgi:predicted enzyme related to lactoylglutathione lyase